MSLSRAGEGPEMREVGVVVVLLLLLLCGCLYMC
jgi:hypothetical protein